MTTARRPCRTGPGDGIPEELAIPRDGPVFADPWDARIFSRVVTLHRAGAFEWKRVQALLVDEIGRSEARGQPRPYYLNWAMAAERLFEALGLASRESLDGRVEALRPNDRTVHHR